uniref:Uncharacterized protein n=1 Tax=Arundo donax TaxID=35708 RepID=A0A0A9B2P3_ARUDO
MICSWRTIILTSLAAYHCKIRTLPTAASVVPKSCPSPLNICRLTIAFSASDFALVFMPQISFHSS